ncbi:MAG TPA: 30S ribosomal protein S6 [Alphaproteobacteria bacterium]|jgi:small subunit ribosomal protein S6|nr:30S ribosomal protein S6 [Alphaproteobacteria bacterium]
MPLYESVFIARQDISAQQVDALTEGFGNVVKERGGEVGKTEYWGLRGLSYRIRKNRKGHYVLLNLEASADAVEELERNYRINEDVIRYMTVRVDELETGPSAMMQSRGGGRGGRDRGDRDRGDRGDRDRGDRGDRDRGDRPRRSDSTSSEGN